MSSPDTTGTNLYHPNFQGIYILTESGVQTRLFDYIDPLTGDEIVHKKDIDKDGDSDYIFNFGGRLYVKYTTKNTPNPIRETSLQTENLTSLPVPTAPNFFRQDLDTPGKISLQFGSAAP